MTPPDDLWMDLAGFDDGLVDRIWNGTREPDEGPAWCDDLDSLLTLGRGSATGDELADEEAVVAAMADVVGTPVHLEVPAGLGAPADLGEPTPATRRRRISVRRVAAAKAAGVAGVIVFGAAAAAATGAVATRVVPGLGDDPPAGVEVPASTSTTTSGGVAGDEPWNRQDEPGTFDHDAGLTEGDESGSEGTDAEAGDQRTGSGATTGGDVDDNSVNTGGDSDDDGAGDTPGDGSETGETGDREDPGDEPAGHGPPSTHGGPPNPGAGAGGSGGRGGNGSPCVPVEGSDDPLSGVTGSGAADDADASSCPAAANS